MASRVCGRRRDGKYHWTDRSCDDANSNYHVRYGAPDSSTAPSPTRRAAAEGFLQELQGTAHQSDVHVTDADAPTAGSWPTIATTPSCSPPASATTETTITFDADGLTQTIHRPTKACPLRCRYDGA